MKWVLFAITAVWVVIVFGMLWLAVAFFVGVVWVTWRIMKAILP